jgi:hypothetical protein
MPTRRLVTAALSLVLLAAAPASAGTSFTFPLTGSQETPPVGTAAHGKCVGILSADESTFELHCAHDAGGVTAAHIHREAAGVAGPVIFGLGNGTSPIQATWNPTAEEVADLLVGNLYVNVHTVAYPGGEIRGQIDVDHTLGDLLSIAFPLEAGQEVPPSGVTAAGRCHVGVSPFVGINVAGALRLTCAHDLGATTAAHIHLGSRGANGSVIFALGDGTSPIRHDQVLSESELATLMAGDYYVNVHTATHPDGALRGQIEGCFENQHTLCLNGGRFAVTAAWEVPPGDPSFTSGSGTAIPLTADSGAFWFFGPDNVELDVKVLDACSFANRYWVFAAGLTNVKVTLTVTDTASGATKSYPNPQGQAFQPILDTDAFDTCP